MNYVTVIHDNGGAFLPLEPYEPTETVFSEYSPDENVNVEARRGASPLALTRARATARLGSTTVALRHFVRLCAAYDASNFNCSLARAFDFFPAGKTWLPCTHTESREKFLHGATSFRRLPLGESFALDDFAENDRKEAIDVCFLPMSMSLRRSA